MDAGNVYYLPPALQHSQWMQEIDILPLPRPLTLAVDGGHTYIVYPPPLQHTQWKVDIHMITLPPTSNTGSGWEKQNFLPALLPLTSEEKSNSPAQKLNERTLKVCTAEQMDPLSISLTKHTRPSVLKTHQQDLRNTLSSLFRF